MNSDHTRPHSRGRSTGALSPRRQFLAASASSLLGVPVVCGARRALAEAESSGTPATARSTIMIVLAGGASHIDTWDMKPCCLPQPLVLLGASTRRLGRNWSLPCRDDSWHADGRGRNDVRTLTSCNGRASFVVDTSHMTVNTQGDHVEIVIVISNSQMRIGDRRGSSSLGLSSVLVPGLATSLLPASSEYHLPFQSTSRPASAP